jgi:hypothetical protein
MKHFLKGSKEMEEKRKKKKGEKNMTVSFHEIFSEGIERKGGKEKEKERGEEYDDKEKYI